MPDAHDREVSQAARGYLQLQLANSIGPVLIKRLVEHFGSCRAVLSASEAQLEAVEDIGRLRARAIRRAQEKADIDQELQTAAEHGTHILCVEDEGYPRLLRHVPDPPSCLYVKGEIKPQDALAVGIVGTRNCSHYGSEQARNFGGLLARAGFTVVSGLARGIDSWAHRGALDAGGRTIGVLGTGLCHVYPPENHQLYEQVTAAGALVSELPMQTPPEAKNFPGRNRIIAGMTLGVIVVEAPPASGALITARLASEYNREVFAVPGRIDVANSRGTNMLIRIGAAKLISNLDDILDELGQVGEAMRKEDDSPTDAQLFKEDVPTGPMLTDVEQLVLRGIDVEGCDIDTIGRTTSLDAGVLTGTLTQLQLKGLVKLLPGNRYVAASRSQRNNTPRVAGIGA